MLLIGSRALASHMTLERRPVDYDFICTYDEYREFVQENKASMTKPLNGNHMVAKINNTMFEFEIAWEGSSAEDILKLEAGNHIASLPMLLLLKESHKYLKDSPHFEKTRQDIKTLRTLTKIPKDWKALLKKREQETYTYSHPKLNQSKEAFFTDAVKYIYDHDSIHIAVKQLDKPAYLYYKNDEMEVMCDMNMFDKLPEHIKLCGVLEESMVLAAERSQLINNKTPLDWSFKKALEKVCTSITSGKFRKYAYDNYDVVLNMYYTSGRNYMDRIYAGIESGDVRRV